MRRRSYLYSALAALVLVSVILFSAAPDLSKMDWRRVGNRAGWQLPDRVIRSLELEPGDSVADIGAGEGYFTFRLAEAVGPDGRVFAVEVDDELIDVLRQKARSATHGNVRVIKGRYDDPLLPDGELDLVFLCNAYHHIQNRVDYFRRLKRDLEPEGRLAIIDMKETLLVRLTVPYGHWTSIETMEDELQRAGYRPIRRFEFLPAQNYVAFARAR